MKAEAVTADVTVVRRVHRNASGDWKKVEAKVKEIKAVAETIETLAKDIVKADKQLRELLLEAYTITPAIDSLFYDSPIAPQKQSYYLKAFLRKLGLDGIQGIHTPTINIVDFSKCIKDGCNWLMKFKSDKTI